MPKSTPWRALGAFLQALCVALALATSPASRAGEALPLAADPVLEARVLKLSAELRCLVCQNQTVADSTSGLADDLRNQVRDMLKRGASDDEVIAFMTARYGDFVLYRPPFKATTALLWAAPALLLVGGVSALLLVLRRRSRLPADAFEADPSEELPATPDTARPSSHNPPLPPAR
jgi:cytochrome c-type biogenesis protein CcmH